MVFVSTFAVYALSAWRIGQMQSPPLAYFNELAVSFLHGHLFLENPALTNDLTFYQENWYVPFPPLPALLMMPWVATLGDVNTILFSIFFGALNVSLVFLIIQALVAAGWIQLRLIDSLWLTILFGLGSVHWYVAKVGTVWFVSQICTVTFVALSVWFAVGRMPLLAGLALAAAMWARPNVALLYPLLYGVGYQESQAIAPVSRSGFLRNWALSSIPPLFIAGIGLLIYNQLRFNNPLDFGYLTQNVAPVLARDLAEYGQFSPHFIPHNLWAMLFALPQWDSNAHVLYPNGAGMSLLITSPALVFLSRARQRSPVVWGAWTSVLLVLIPLLTYYNTGEYQFGYRYSLDFMVPMMVLLAYASREHMSILMRILIVAGMVVNAWGLRWCC